MSDDLLAVMRDVIAYSRLHDAFQDLSVSSTDAKEQFEKLKLTLLDGSYVIEEEAEISDLL